MQALDALGLNVRRLLAIGLQPLQIAACAEGRAFARDDNGADIRAALRHAERLHARRIHFGAERVAMLGVAQGQDHGPPLARALQFGRHQASSCRSDRPIAPRRRSQGLGR